MEPVRGVPYLEHQLRLLAQHPVAGIHFNKAHKGKQNFPGWKQMLIKPFDIL